MVEALPLSFLRSNDRAKVLSVLDWSSEKTREFGQAVIGEYSVLDPDDAVMARGMRAYLTAVKSVRKILASHGWTRKREGNVELVHHQVKNIAICVSSADKNTGIHNAQPRNRNKKGSECAYLVRQNQKILHLPFINQFELKNENIDKLRTWFLFYFFDKENKEMRIEISLPLRYDFDKREIYGFHSRIIFDPIKFDDNFVPHLDDSTPDEHDFVIKVKKNE